MTAGACDLLVIGSGAGGLSAAVTAAARGLDVIVIEKEAVVGGTSAWSGGWLWIPRNPLAIEAGIREERDAVETYLRHELGASYDPVRVGAFLDHGPAMVEFFRRETAIEWVDGNRMPDFHGASPGAAEGGRSVSVAPFDGRELGAKLALVRPPLDLLTFCGMGIAAGELRHFLDAMRDWASFVYSARRVRGYALDLLVHGRGMKLVAGNALVARLVKSALDRGVDIRVSTPARRLIHEEGRVAGAMVTTGTGEAALRARRGVVLACGGFPHDAARRRALFPHAPAGTEHWSAAPPSNTGDGLRLGEGVGGVVDENLAHAAGFAPVSLVPRRDGTFGHFPHLVERGKPGLIAVTARGKRFVNEAGSYHDFMTSLFAVVPQGEPIACWLLCDHRFIRRYGLGYAKPWPLPLRPELRSRYLLRANTIAALARTCGIDVAAMQATVDDYNRDARDGRDAAFDRGSTAYNRAQGDGAWTPNPCVAPIERAPFYAVRIVPGSLGTFAGLRTDASARVLDAADQPIAGLYACGADMASIMGGRYPSGGINLGPAMTFGYVAARHAAMS